MSRRKRSSIKSTPVEVEVKATPETSPKPIDEEKGQVENGTVYIQYPTTPEHALRVDNVYKLVEVST